MENLDKKLTVVDDLSRSDLEAMGQEELERVHEFAAEKFNEHFETHDGPYTETCFRCAYYEELAGAADDELRKRFSSAEKQTLESEFKYLDALRESGAVNMFGAAPHLEEQFGLDRREAKAVLAEWMETFSDRTDRDRS